jgi:hypothetical protein
VFARTGDPGGNLRIEGDHMKRLYLALMVSGLLTAVMPLTSGEATDRAEPGSSGPGTRTAIHGAGTWYRYGALDVIELHGSYREMGRQYGALRREVLHEIHRRMADNKTLVAAAVDLTVREQELKAVYAAYPDFNELMTGIAETSGLGDRVYLACSYIQLFHILTAAAAAAPDGCSFNAAWGRYTANAQVIVGRNFDLSRVMNDRTEIVVYNPDDGSIPVARIGYAGSVYVTSGINRAGLFLELNNGDVPFGRLKPRDGSAAAPAAPPGTDTYLELFQLLQRSADTADLDRHFARANTTVGCIINVADSHGAFSYEWIPGKYKRRASFDSESLVATNDFIDPSWGLTVPPPGSPADVGQSMLRLFNLMMMNYRHKGAITPQVMMQIMSTPVEAGGPFFPTYTSYQMIVVPASLTVWFRVPDIVDWTEVDLKQHFDSARR